MEGKEDGMDDEKNVDASHPTKSDNSLCIGMNVVAAATQKLMHTETP